MNNNCRQVKLVKTEFQMTVPSPVLCVLSMRVLIQPKDLLKIMAKDLIYKDLTDDSNQMILKNEQIHVLE